MTFSGTDTYVATEDLMVAVNAAITLERPLLVKGEPGTGKTILAHEVAKALDKPLIQWHIKSTTKAQQGLYEYDAVSRLRDSQLGDERVHDIANYIVRGKLWDSFEADAAPVLLIDEIDRADEEFEAYLLEILSDFQISVPELGTIRATAIPQVILTANGTRDLSDALRRRCLYAYVEFPEPERELQILKARVPEVGNDLANQVVRFVAKLRREDLEKKPGIAETLDWVAALVDLNVADLDGDLEALRSSLVCLLKTEADAKAVTPEVLARLADQAA